MGRCSCCDLIHCRAIGPERWCEDCGSQMADGCKELTCGFCTLKRERNRLHHDLAALKRDVADFSKCASTNANNYLWNSLKQLMAKHGIEQETSYGRR